jgi:AcrR family transcriptional regulator
MNALARRARVARATVYNHFANADSVLEGLVEAETAKFLRDLDRLLAPIPDASDQLRTAITALIGWVTRQARQRPASVPAQRNPRPPDITRIHRPLAALRGRIAASIAAAQAAGTGPASANPRLAAGFAVDLVFGSRERLAADRDGRVAIALRAFVLAGLGLDPPRSLPPRSLPPRRYPISPICRARATASVRLATPSLASTWVTCFFTVSSVTTNWSAMP